MPTENAESQQQDKRSGEEKVWKACRDFKAPRPEAVQLPFNFLGCGSWQPKLAPLPLDKGNTVFDSSDRRELWRTFIKAKSVLYGFTKAKGTFSFCPLTLQSRHSTDIVSLHPAVGEGVGRKDAFTFFPPSSISYANRCLHQTKPSILHLERQIWNAAPLGVGHMLIPMWKPGLSPGRTQGKDVDVPSTDVSRSGEGVLSPVAPGVQRCGQCALP